MTKIKGWDVSKTHINDFVGRNIIFLSPDILDILTCRVSNTIVGKTANVFIGEHACVIDLSKYKYAFLQASVKEAIECSTSLFKVLRTFIEEN